MRIAVIAVLISLSSLGLSYAESGIEIKDAWVRETPPGSTITAMYMNIVNTTGQQDALTSVSSNVSKVAELHTTSVNDKGVAKMEMLESISIPSGGSAKLEPGGMHIMLIDLEKPLKSGEKVEVLMVFDKAGQVKTEAQVLGPGEGGQSHEHHHH